MRDNNKMGPQVNGSNSDNTENRITDNKSKEKFTSEKNSDVHNEQLPTIPTEKLNEGFER
jgi:hypothetical protein